MKFLSTIFTGMLLLLTTTLSHGAIVYTDCGDGVTPELGGGIFSRVANYSFNLPQDTANAYQMSYSIMDTTFHPSGGQVTKLTRIRNIAAAGTLDSDNQTWLAYKLDAGVSVGEATSFQTEEESVSRVAMLYAESTVPSNDFNGYWENMAPEETGFIGLSFSYGDDMFYGWAELGIDTDTGMFTVYGYAYDDAPGTAVLTGDTGSPVPVPSAGWLMITGILALAGFKRARREA